MKIAMNKLVLIIVVFFSAIMGCAKNNDMNKIDSFREEGYVYDSIETPSGRTVNLIFIKHGSIVLDIDNYLVYIDPVTMFGNDFSLLPKGDIILVTHEHGDHYDKKALDELIGDDTQLITNGRVKEMYGGGDVMEPGDSSWIKNADFNLMAVPAYNITPEHLQFHPKERKDLGFVFDIDGLKIYVAGDTEDIPEMAELKDIDIAFIPVNQPYTMTPEQAIHAIEMINPKIVYPYHYGNTDLTPIIEKFKDSKIDVRIRQLQ